MENLESNPRYEEARRHARALRSFYSHALVYVCVNGGLIAFNLVMTPERIWSTLGALGWGIGLLAHGISVFVGGGWMGADWEQRKIRQYLDRR